MTWRYSFPLFLELTSTNNLIRKKKNFDHKRHKQRSKSTPKKNRKRWRKVREGIASLYWKKHRHTLRKPLLPPSIEFTLLQSRSPDILRNPPPITQEEINTTIRNSKNQTPQKDEEKKRGENTYLLLLAGILGEGRSGCMHHRRIWSHLNRSNHDTNAAEGRRNENRSFPWKFETLEWERKRLDRLGLCIIFLRFLLVQVKCLFFLHFLDILLFYDLIFLPYTPKVQAHLSNLFYW